MKSFPVQFCLTEPDEHVILLLPGQYPRVGARFYLVPAIPPGFTRLYSVEVEPQGIERTRCNLVRTGLIYSELHTGMYFYSLIAKEKEVDTKRMILTE